MPAQVQSWADDVDAEDFPPRTETVDKDGIITIVEYRLNDDDNKVKVTRRIKRTLVKSNVNHAVAERMGWAKFGAEKGHKPGPDTATTTVGENVRLKLAPGGIKQEEEEPETKRPLIKKITCRLCQGDHYTTRCPYKETLGGITGEGDTGEDTSAGPSDPNASASDLRAAGGKYVPPSQRAGAKSAGESMGRPGGVLNRDDLPTLRVTNLSEETTEDDMWDLCGRFGKIHRIYVGKDQETGLCKGFAFISFESRGEAEKALVKLNRLPYAHQILNCAWSVPKGEKA